MKKDVKTETIEELKNAWDLWDGVNLSNGFDCEEVHLELNLRGEGEYCAV